MMRKNPKSRCTKKAVSKAVGVCRLYSALQEKCLDHLQADEQVKSIRCNVPLDGQGFTSDFMCQKSDGSYLVRECVERKHIAKPRNLSLLDISRDYWIRHGVNNWGIVTDKEVHDA